MICGKYSKMEESERGLRFSEVKSVGQLVKELDTTRISITKLHVSSPRFSRNERQ